MPRFESFVLFAGMRTGSNFLEANLNELAGVASYGEAFNPGFIGKKDQTELLGVTLEARDADPARLLHQMRARTDGLFGFRFFHDHDERVLQAVLADQACAKIILTRNPVESYVSLKIARATGQWKLNDARRLKTATVTFDPAEFETHLTTLQSFHLRLVKALQTSGQTAFYLDYEDLTDLAVLNGLARFLGVDARLEAIDDTLKKQNPQDLDAKVTNPDEMHAALARLDRFNLARTPNFEPRRTAGIPAVVAAAGAPLVFFPVRSGPESTLRDWLSALGGGGLIDGFGHKALRQWTRANPGHRSFTVVRHPLLRAYSVFRGLILPGKLAEQRRQLVRHYKAVLPEPGAEFADPDAERAAFLLFMHVARLSAAGQTGARVDANLASQTAIVQGFAGFHPVDLVIREDRLQAGLDYLAAEVGSAVQMVAVDMAYRDQLARIHDRSLEKVAANAYPRDYAGFGFGAYQP